MTSRELLRHRLGRIARELRFRFYVVCPGCFSPIIMFGAEIESPPSYLGCDECGKLMRFDPEAVREYAPSIGMDADE